VTDCGPAAGQMPAAKIAVAKMRTARSDFASLEVFSVLMWRRLPLSVVCFNALGLLFPHGDLIWQIEYLQWLAESYPLRCGRFTGVMDLTQSSRERRQFRFGVFEFDCSTGELRRDGRTEPRLRDQAVQILTMLLERPREVVTREEIQQALWPADTFVDFEHGVNTAVNQLRGALGDSAANPRFIQTLPRRGYRFIAPVEIVGAENSGVAAAGGTSADAVALEVAVARDDDLPVASDAVVRGLFSLIQIMYLTFYLIALARLRQIDAILQQGAAQLRWVLVILILTAAVGIPIRLYLLTAAAFRYRGLMRKFRTLFPFVFVLDEIWALAPFLLVQQLGLGIDIACTAALLYVPFSQRTLLRMGHSSGSG
jgi:cholera toxin transcriptional activator